MGRSYKTEAIILKRKNLNEADRLITVFSREKGKLTVLAKGIRRLNSRKKGHLEPFTLSRLEVARGKSLDLITEAFTINGFPKLRLNLNRVRIAYLLLELTDKLTAENQEQVDVFNLLNEALEQLNSDAAANNLILEFEVKLLQSLGFGLPLRTDRAALEAHISEIIEKPLSSKKLK